MDYIISIIQLRCLCAVFSLLQSGRFAFLQLSVFLSSFSPVQSSICARKFIHIALTRYYFCRLNHAKYVDVVVANATALSKQFHNKSQKSYHIVSQSTKASTVFTEHL